MKLHKPLRSAGLDLAQGCGSAGTEQGAALSRPVRSLYAGKTVIAVGAHPDDLEIGVGGTLAHLAKEGARVVMVTASVPNHFETRLAESQNSARLLGGEFRLLLTGGCRRLEDLKNYELVTLLDDLVKELSPAAIFSHGPSDFHNDHTMIYRACLSSQRLKFVDFFCYYPTSCRPSALPFSPRVYVDVTATIDKKMEAINAHPSQFAGRGLDTNFYRDIAREQGRKVGVAYAEGMEVVQMLVV